MHTRLDPLLVRQHGVVTTAQCHEAGLSRREVATLLSSGRLLSVFRGVLRDPAAPRSFDQRAMAATLVGAGAVASHRMAIAVWGMRNYRCELAEITSTRKVDRPGIIAHRSTERLPMRRVRGIPVTTRERTLLDVSTVVSDRIVIRFLEAWLSSGVVKLPRLESVIDDSFGHHGVATLRRILRDHDLSEIPDSPPEGTIGDLLVRHGLSQPVLHYVVSLRCGLDFELDWSFPELKVGLEVDGYGVHLRSLDAFEYDRSRRNELEIEGWVIMNFSRRQITSRPRTVVDQVSRMLRNRRLVDPAR